MFCNPTIESNGPETRGPRFSRVFVFQPLDINVKLVNAPLFNVPTDLALLQGDLLTQSGVGGRGKGWEFRTEVKKIVTGIP